MLPEYPFSYKFLDDHFKELHRTDAQVSQMVAIMSGLAPFSTERRTKEIAVRKILGASVQDVVLLLSRHFIGLVLIGNLIAWPLELLIALGTVSVLTVKAAINNPVKSMRTE